MRAARNFVRLAGAALDLVAPPRCLACDGDDAVRWGLCARCLRRLPRFALAPCPRCASALGPGIDAAACGVCADLRPQWKTARAASIYAGFVGELIRRAKYGRDPLLAVPLRGLVLDTLARGPAPPEVDAVVPVPATRRRQRERGFNLAELLADPVARAVGARLRSAWLERPGDPPPQAALTRTERQLAARGTFVTPVAPRRAFLRPFLACVTPGARVLLVDDVLTTGATANACARALLRAGVREVHVAVAARA